MIKEVAQGRIGETGFRVVEWWVGGKDALYELHRQIDGQWVGRGPFTWDAWDEYPQDKQLLAFGLALCYTVSEEVQERAAAYLYQEASK